MLQNLPLCNFDVHYFLGGQEIVLLLLQGPYGLEIQRRRYLEGSWKVRESQEMSNVLLKIQGENFQKKKFPEANLFLLSYFQDSLQYQ